MIISIFVCNFVCGFIPHTNSNLSDMEKKYKHRINFRLEQRKSKSEKEPTEVPILADITFNSKRIWYHSGFRIAPSKWDDNAQRVKRNNFNEDEVSATDINKRLVEIETAVHSVFEQLEFQEIDPTPISVREELKRILSEEKSTRLTVVETYQILIDEREKELKETPATATWTLSTLKKHKTMKAHLAGFRVGLYFEDLSVEMIEKFELHLIGKGLTNSYVTKSMVDIKTFLNWASAKGFNKNMAYKKYKNRYKEDAKDKSVPNNYALTMEEINAIMAFPTKRKAIQRARDILIFSCFSGMRFNEVMLLRWSNIVGNGDIVDMTPTKTRHRVKYGLLPEAQAILRKYPKAPDEEDPLVFPTISNQKYNDHLKEIGRLAGMTDDWIIEKRVGREVSREIVKKYEVLSSHVGRRTFVTTCRNRGLRDEGIRSATGHTTTEMMDRYDFFSEDNIRERMGMLNSQEIETQITVFDVDITDAERVKLGLPTEDAYFEMFEGDTASSNAHLAMLFHIRGDKDKRASFMKKLSNDRLNEVLEMMMAK